MVRLKPGKIRGDRLRGHGVSEKELDLSDEHEGIIVLPDDAPVGTPLVDYLGDAILEFDIKGAFGYLQSVIGIAREVAALTGQALRLPPGAAPADQKAQIVADPDFAGIGIDAPDLCLRYSAALIEGLQVGPSPYWMQQRLLRAGMRPINNIVDVTNYVMLELGQPLHAFDYDLLRLRVPEGSRKRSPRSSCAGRTPGEHLTTLDGVDRDAGPGHAADHRYGGRGGRGRRDGRRQHRGPAGHDMRPAGSGQLQLPEHPAHGATAQADQRGGPALRQASRPRADRHGADAGR